MSISSIICKRTYQADGSTRAWTVDFPVLAGEDIRVYVTSADGTETPVHTGYEVNLQAGEVIYPTVASGLDPLAQGQSITLLRTTDLTQAIHLTQNGNLDPNELESGYDKLTLQVQELDERTGRCIKYPVSSGKTGADADTFLAELAATQATALSGALASVDQTKTALEQTVADEATARQQADSTLQSAINTKQNALSTDQQNAVNSNVTAAKVAAYDAHLADTANPHSVTKTQVGLGNVDNTADLDKPISTAVQTALDAKQASGDYATNTALTTGLAAKQDTLTTAQLAAVNSGVTAVTVARVQTNQQEIASLDAELDENRPWLRPEGWPDIRNGALANSVYFLVAHSADFQTYPQFVFNATISNSGTYDVFVDGIKVTTQDSADTTTLNWSTLYSGGTIAGGIEVTYPSALVTHIVRVTPSSSSNAISGFNPVITDGYDAPQMGVLWCHITVATALSFHFGSSYKNVQPILESITGANGVILCKECVQIIRNCWELKHIDTLDFSDDIGQWTTNHFQGQFHGCRKLKKLRLKNIKQNKTNGAWYTFTDSVFADCNSLQKIEAENVIMNLSSGMFSNNGLLKSITGIQFGPIAESTVNIIFKGCTSLESTYLDFSTYSTIQRLTLGGNSSAQLNGIKSLTVSASAPFDSATSPQLDVSYTGMNRIALVNLFKSMPTVTDSQVCNVTGCSGVADLTADDLAIATAKGWTVTR